MFLNTSTANKVAERASKPLSECTVELERLAASFGQTVGFVSKEVCTCVSDSPNGVPNGFGALMQDVASAVDTTSIQPFLDKVSNNSFYVPISCRMLRGLWILNSVQTFHRKVSFTSLRTAILCRIL